MMNLAEYRRSNTRLADFLPWAALVDEGIVLNKDGSFQRTAKFRGPDLDSAVPAELVAVAGRLNNALRRLEQLIQEAVVTVPRALIAETIDVIAVLSGRGVDRRLAELASVTGLAASGDYSMAAIGDKS